MKEEEEYDISFETRTVGTTPFSTKYVEDENVEAGKEIVKQNGANGLQTETYKIKSLNGNVISREVLSRDTYTPMQRIIIKGTMGAEVEATPTDDNNTQSVTIETNPEPNAEQQESAEVQITEPSPEEPTVEVTE